MATIRSSNSENLGGGNPTLGKGGMTTRGGLRSALGEVGNKNVLHQHPATKKALQQVTKPSKPARQPHPTSTAQPGTGLTRQKASANLQLANNGRRLLPARKAAEEAIQKTRQQSLGSGRRSQQQQEKKEDEEPMEIEQEQQQDVHMQDESDALSCVAQSASSSPVEDIDRDDRGNPQLACDYVNEIYAYMRSLERKLAIRENYLEMLQGNASIRPKMRNMLVDWLVEVHQQFNLLQETLYLTVSTIDRFLQVKATVVSTKQLQLVGITAMFIASKYEEMYPPEIGDFVYISDHAYSASQIRKMEISMMAALNFDLGRPLPLNFLRRNSKAAQVNAHTHSLAKYAMELTLIDYRMAHVHPSIAAAASLAFAMRVLDQSGSPLRLLWTPTLVHYTSYSLDTLYPVVKTVAEIVDRATKAVDGVAQQNQNQNTGNSKKPWKQLESVGKKYKNKKFMKISLIPELRTELVDRMAKGQDI